MRFIEPVCKKGNCPSLAPERIHLFTENPNRKSIVGFTLFLSQVPIALKYWT